VHALLVGLYDAFYDPKKLADSIEIVLIHRLMILSDRLIETSQRGS